MKKKQKTIKIYGVKYTGLSRVVVRLGREIIDEETTQNLIETLERFKKLYKSARVVD